MRLMPLLALAPALLAAGCATGGVSRTAFAPAEVQPRGAAAVERNLLAPLGGGLVAQGNLLRAGSRDQRSALEAEYKALEYARGGESIAWEGSGVSGTVTPAQPYQVGSQNCRQYTHAVDAGGTVSEFKGAACRNPDGSWTLLN
ncbi:MAG: hypothetical protein CMJ42_11295 [Phyllobacteriaceae bacterium]|nr:hypothetical protein [Phyllobacteriaceae bacterium]MBA89286.1 hypothetical protein [Phyllobacteriaceae bacterium]